jgi:site-specific recombinase XerD
MPVLRAGSRGAGATAGPAPAEPQQAAKTVRTYTEAVAWFAAAHLIPRTSHARWEQISGHDVQRWLVHMLTRYSDAHASNQFRALQQFFRWLAEEEQLPDPMTRGGSYATPGTSSVTSRS